MSTEHDKTDQDERPRGSTLDGKPTRNATPHTRTHGKPVTHANETI